MALPPQFDQPPGRSLRRLDRAIDRGQSRVFRILWFMVPPGSVVWNGQFQALLASRFLTDIALQALLYGTLIAVARGGGTAMDAALIGVAYLLPGVVLGMYGGAVADALPKRVALGGAYFTMSGLCFLLPGLFGTSFAPLLLVLFAVRTLHQVSQPSEASAVPLVATREELASANSFLSFASSAGEVIGKALLAPLIVRYFGVNPVTVLAGLLFLLSATRVLDFHVTGQGERGHRPVEEAQVTEGPAPAEPAVERPSIVVTFRWLMEEPAAFWMLMLAAMASTVSVVLGMLGPQYTREVLGVDPAFALYVFAPASVGLVVGLVAAPWLIALTGERAVATVGFALVGVAMGALGLVDQATIAFGWVLVFDIPRIGPEIEMAAAISTFLGLGVTLAAAATQTYIGRYVPIAIHGRMFALLGTMKDGLAIVPLLTIGALATLVGVRTVITLAPILLVALAFGVEFLTTRWGAPAPRPSFAAGERLTRIRRRPRP